MSLSGRVLHMRRDIIMNKSKAAAGLCDWAINIVKYFDVVAEVEPKRLELAAANEKLASANTTMAAVQAKVAALNEQVQQLEAQYAKVKPSSKFHLPLAPSLSPPPASFAAAW